MEIKKYDGPTYGRTDGLTWEGARDTCMSKNITKDIITIPTLKRVLFVWVIKNTFFLFGHFSLCDEKFTDLLEFSLRAQLLSYRQCLYNRSRRQMMMGTPDEC